MAVYFQQRGFHCNPEETCHGEQLLKLHGQLTTKEVVSRMNTLMESQLTIISILNSNNLGSINQIKNENFKNTQETSACLENDTERQLVTSLQPEKETRVSSPYSKGICKILQL